MPRGHCGRRRLVHAQGVEHNEAARRDGAAQAAARRRQPQERQGRENGQQLRRVLPRLAGVLRQAIEHHVRSDLMQRCISTMSAMFPSTVNLVAAPCLGRNRFLCVRMWTGRSRGRLQELAAVAALVPGCRRVSLLCVDSSNVQPIRTSNRLRYMQWQCIFN